MTSSSNPAPSKQLIVQFAARALRRVHLEWQSFSLGHAGKTDADVRVLNVGRGAEVALETAVGAAFAQEFNSSKLTHGWLAPVHDDTRRYFVVDREVSFRRAPANPYERIDLLIRRIKLDTDPYDFGIMPIELKRARRFIPDLASGKAERVATHGATDVADDIKKLAWFSQQWRENALDEKSCEYVRHRRTNEVYPHVLVWGINDEETRGSKDALPEVFLNEAFEKAGAARKSEPRVEWLPMVWEERRLLDGPPENVTTWMWIAYAEIQV